MIRAARAQRERQVSGAVLLRDVVRAARRSQTWVLRTGFAAVLMGFFGLVWTLATFGPRFVDPADLGKAARGVFVAYAVVQVLVVSLVAPFGVAAAVIEERDRDTLDLLLLTRLTVRQMLLAKVVARLLLVATVVLGALPVLALLTSLGGVSPVEVVAVTVHALVTAVVLGIMGGFFAIFTGSPVLATFAALGWGLLAFVLVPFVYVTLTLDWQALAWFSPLYGTAARDWWALLPAFTYVPEVLMLLALGTRFYGLRASGATLEAFYRPGAWRVRGSTPFLVALGIGFVFAVPLAVLGAWYVRLGHTLSAGWQATIETAAHVVLWPWGAGMLVLFTWLYLRVAMDLVVMADQVRSPAGGRPFRARGSGRVWGNPVAWQALRRHSWRATGPGLALWLFVQLVAFQSGLWAVPGGLLVWGGANAAIALVLTVWLGVGTVAVERRTGTLEILLASPMSSGSILFGKAVGVAVPTLLVLLLSVPMFLLGTPYFHVYFLDGSHLGWFRVVLEGVAVTAWVLGLWIFVLAASLFLALRLRRPETGYPVGVGALAVWLLAPTVLAAITRDTPWASEVFRLLVPVLVVRPSPWEAMLSLFVLLVAAAVLFAVSCVKLREWGLRGG